MSRYRILILLAATLSATLWAYACGDGATEPPTPPPDPPRPATVTVTPATTQLTAMGATVQLSAEVRDQNGQVMAGAGVTWTSSNASVATVSGSGLVTAAGNGTATITASAGGVSGTATVTVAQEVGAVVVSPGADTVVAGDTLRLAAEATDANGHAVAGAAFAWASSDTLVTLVDDSGLATGVAEGEAEITATSSGATGRAQVTVVAPVPTTVAVTPDSVGFTAIGQTEQLSAEVRDQIGRAMVGEAASWSSSDTLVAMVDSGGLVTAAGNGTATITASAGGVSGTATVTVAQEVGAVVVSPGADTVVAGDTLRLAAEATDANGHAVAGAAFAWASSDTLVTLVDDSGLATGVADGEAEITATSSGVTGRAQVTVVAPVPTTVAVTPDSVGFTAIGQTEQLSAEVRDQIGRAMVGEAASWSSSDTLVAMVDSGGLVTAAGNGSAIVSAAAREVSGSAVVTVTQSAGTVTVSPSADTIAPGDTLQLVAKASDENGHPVEGAAFAWSSSDVSVASVDRSGLVRGVAQGMATITAAAGQARGTAKITVENPDRAALVALYEATGGPNWVNNEGWLTDAPLAQWTGVVVDPQGRVSSLRLTRNNLKGPIPAELSELTRLEELVLHNNHLKGPIPAELSSLARLEVLHLGWNALTGSIPPELRGLGSLKELALHRNHLSGDIPPELGDLASLEELSLGGQSIEGKLSLTGTIPSELGGLVNLRYLHIGSNLLTGPIPPELGRLTNLEFLNLQYNRLTGLIPPELGDLASLRQLWLNFLPGLTGPIPPEIGDLGRLEQLEFGWNEMGGPIPSELGNLSSLKVLGLGDNRLAGPIPPELGRLANLERLDLGGNELASPIPPELGDLGKLEFLNLNDSDVTGSIPAELGGLSNLGGLYMGLNRLTGSLPPELGQLHELEELWLEDNDFTALPDGVPELRSLSSLRLSGNRLTSDGLPSGAFSKLPSLQWLDLRDNRLTELPAGIFLGLPRLPRLDLEGNPGSPFKLTLKVERVDSQDQSAPGPARVAIRLAEGAPIDLRIPLSVHGGTISANSAVLQAGDDGSTEVLVTQEVNLQKGTEVVAGPLPVLPAGLIGIDLAIEGSLVLFGEVSNRAPVPERAIPSLRMRSTGPSSVVDASRYFRDPDGDELEYSAASSDFSVVSVSVAGDRLTVSPVAAGSATIRVGATDTGGLTAQSSFSVSVRGGLPGSYAIDLFLIDAVSESVETAFRDAVDHWESILKGTELPDVPVREGVQLGCRNITTNPSMSEIDDLVIVASVTDIDGPGSTLASASVCAIRAESHLPAIGAMRFDAADLAVLEETDNLEEVILHEIGHVLGIGTVWDQHDLLVNPSLPNNKGADTHFPGPLAVAAFNDAGGLIYTGGQKVPVENIRRAGSGDSHWRESVLEHELMTPLVGLRVANPLSAITVQSLADLGYTVDVSLAEPFRLPGVAGQDVAGDLDKIEYGDDVMQGPIIVFDHDGNVVRVIPD